MDQDQSLPAAPNSAAQAFAELRAEISLLRRAVERLTDERISQPDYAPTLEAIAKSQETFVAWAKRINDKPGIRFAPMDMAQEMSHAARTARERDVELLSTAIQQLQTTAIGNDALVKRAKSVADQQRELLRNRVAFTLVGMVAFTMVPGFLARSLPESWAVPERIAARTIRKDMWVAGQDMMAKADPEHWRRIVERERNAPDR